MNFDVYVSLDDITPEDDYASVEVFQREITENDYPLFVKFYQINSEGCGFVQRPTDATEQEFREFAEEYLDDPEFGSHEFGLYASTDDDVIRLEPDESGSKTEGILTCRVPFEEKALQDLYIEGSEPFSKEVYDDLVSESLRDMIEEIQESEFEVKDFHL